MFKCSFEGERVDEVMCHDEWSIFPERMNAWTPSNPEETSIEPYDGNRFIYLRKMTTRLAFGL